MRTGSVLITGAARRVGRALALDLAATGWAVVAHFNRSAAEADELQNAIRGKGGEVRLVRGDLAQPATLSRLVEEAARGQGQLTCLINNAARFEPDEIGSISEESWSRHLDTNLKAPVFLAQAFALQLPKTERGNIINIIDQRVWRPNPRFFSYTTSKAALWAATRTLAQALAPNIRVNAIGPGPTLPAARMSSEEFERQSGLTMLGRGTSPEEICAAVRYILGAPAMTGQMIVLDGGQHLAWQTPDVVAVQE
jgi:NAD(P)-dependent dehydrogenase (short-subunit alcohol dehydrogenase family)